MEAADAGCFVATEEGEGAAGLDFEAREGGLAFGFVEVVEGGGLEGFEGGDFAVGDFEGGGGVAELGWGAEEVEGEGELVFGPCAGVVEDGGEGEPAVEEPFAALAGAAELAGDEGGFFGEGSGQGFGVEAAVVLPAEGGALGGVGDEDGFVALAALDAEGFDDELAKEPFLLGAVGGVGFAPIFEAEGDGLGVVGRDDGGVDGHEKILGRVGEVRGELSKSPGDVFWENGWGGFIFLGERVGG